MGYYIEQKSADFKIRKENHARALGAIHRLMDRGQRFIWVRPKDVYRAKTLSEALYAWRWETSVDEASGDIVGISFIGEKSGDDELLFEVIAPFVEPGSNIVIIGEDHHIWRWYFDGSTCSEQDASLTF